MPAVLKGDGLMTDEPGVLLGIQTADCIPVLVADRKQRAVAAFHAGLAWHAGAHRGKRSRPHAAGVRLQAGRSASPPSDRELGSAAMPSGKRCGSNSSRNSPMRQNSSARYTTPTRSGKNIPCCFSLPARPATATSVPPCTWIWRRRTGGNCSRRASERGNFSHRAVHGCRTDRFFSHRMERGFTGRMMSVIGIAHGWRKRSKG